jgi:hypothetical protein
MRTRQALAATLACATIMGMLGLVGCSAAQAAMANQSPTDGASGLPTATVGSVVVATSAVSYSARATVVVIVSNIGAQTIYAENHRTDCSEIELERSVAGAWTPVRACAVLTATVVRPIDAGQSLSIQLPGTPTDWPPGTYRAAIRYGATRESPAATVAYSPTFQIA